MPYLPAAVESILCQTMSQYRFIIIDDGSTDGSAAYLNSLVDPRVEIVHQDNSGLGASLNRAIELCQTPYLARMDADDISLPDRLARQMAYLEAHPEVVMLGTQVRFFSGERSFAGPRKALEHAGIRRALLAGQAAVCHASCIFSLAAMRSAGGYRIDRAGQDIDLFLRMSEVGLIANMPEVLYQIRVHGESVCSKSADQVQMWRTYSVECARCRDAEKPEPTAEEFRAQWSRRGLWRRMLDGVDVWSARQYRRAMVDLGSGATVRGNARLAVAAICRPGGTLRRLKSALGKRGSGQAQ
jgi:glycosyltransferase involved in cell wall biosynthesis